MQRHKGGLLVALACCLVALQSCQPPLEPTPPATASSCGRHVEATLEERQFHQLFNHYRRSRGLPSISLSTSMTVVAQQHARDLQATGPQGTCGLHSWSRRGSWSACCYTPDHRQKQCMWDKPRELTQYPGNGYEIAVALDSPNGAGITPQKALSLLQRSREHNMVMLNQGPWVPHPWTSVGVGMAGQYAVIWFGEERDPCGYF